MSKPWFSRLNSARRADLARRRSRSLRTRMQLESLEGRQLLSTFHVNTDEDSGAGSLRQAIINSDNTPATAANPNTIVLDFSTGITLLQLDVLSQEPTITQPVTIDFSAYMKKGAPGVQLSGNYAGSALGLDIGPGGSGTTIRGLAINGFSNGGVLIDGASHVTIDHDYIGINPNNNTVGSDNTNGQTIVSANGTYGLTVTDGAQSNVISNNEITGNTYNGLILSGTGTDYNQVFGNAIGADNTGLDHTDDSLISLGNGVRGGGGSGIIINQGASNNTIGGTTVAARNLIQNNATYGIYITDSGTSGNVVEGNYIGVAASGTTTNDGNGNSLGNVSWGVGVVNGASGNTIGPVSGTLGNVISGNGGGGVLLFGPGTMNNSVVGDRIGTDVNGQLALPNNGDGVLIANQANSNTIGGTTLVTNVISGNAGNGVEVTGGSAADVVSGNLIGTNGLGTAAIPNTGDGVHVGNNAEGTIVGSTSANLFNLISGNAGNGVVITDAGTTDNTVEGNFIGTTISGTAPLGNSMDGVLVEKTATFNTIGAGSVISGNGTWGVYITDTGTTNNVVEGDFIGTDATGTKAIPNTNNGVDIVFGAQNNTIGGTTATARNVISGNANEGVLIGFAGTSSNVVEGNFIGTDVTGKVALPNQLDGVYVGLGASNNTIGGQTNAAAWNVISGNNVDGIKVTDSGTTGTTIFGNFIGTDVTGKVALPNQGNGVEITAGTSSTLIGQTSSGSQALNVISGNKGDGVKITSSNGNIIGFNTIGTDSTNTVALGNGGNGVSISAASGNNLGADLIENNGGYGILTTNGSSNNFIQTNSIFSNVLGGISELNNPTLQPAANLTGLSTANGVTVVTGTVSASPTKSASLTIQFFSSPFFSTPASIQGKTYVGQVIVTTDANGNASFSAPLTSLVPAGQIITALVIDVTSGSTGMFSNALTVASGTASASFVATDTTTLGHWRNTYGADGYDIAGTNASLPSYATVSVTGSTYVWGTNTGSPFALQNPATGGDIASTWFSSTSFNINVNLTDGKTHLVTLYALDWDQLKGWNTPRDERIDVLDTATGAVLDTRTLSSFQGEYVSWNLKGNVTIRVTNLAANNNAVVAGLFFGGAPTASNSASFVSTDTTTLGHWRNTYGADGYDIAGTNASLPSYATVSVTGSTYVWGTNTGSPFALQNPATGGDIASTWFSSTSFNINVNLTDGKTHLVTLYALDWDQLKGWNTPRDERIDVLDTATGAVLDTRTLSSFQGEYVSWNLKGNVTIRVTNLAANNNAVVAGLFFGGAPTASNSASFVSTDTTTLGHWRNTYGADGYDIAGDTSAANPKLPSYATVSVTGPTFIWGTNTGSPFALQNAAANGDIASTWYSSTSFNINVNLTDGKTHRVTLYALDWDQLKGWNTPRDERIDILDATTGAVLDTRTLSSFQGEYVSWNITGNVTIRVTNLAANNNAVVSGLFFG